MELTWQAAAIAGCLPLSIVVFCAWLAGRDWAAQLEQFEARRSD